MTLIYEYLNQLGALRADTLPKANNIFLSDAYKIVLSNENKDYETLRTNPKRSIMRRSAEFPVYEKGNSGITTHNELQEAILNNTNSKVYQFISENLDLKKNYRNIIFNTPKKAYIDNVDFSSVRAIVNIHTINYIADLNNYFRAVNKLLPDAGLFIGRVEVYNKRILNYRKKYGKALGNLLSIYDFIANRVMPKVKPLDKLYKFLTQDKFHVYSKAEVLGRMVYSGFDIIECIDIDGLHYVVGMKTTPVNLGLKNGSYYPFFKMQRVGKDGKMIGVYKLRTMHPYSEYIQDYVIKLNGYNDKGKPADDFRVTPWGKWMRRLWLDEFPQILNLLKGELKLVGVRPLSKVRFNALPKEVQDARIKHKPGCFPPYVALCMPDEEQNIEAEIIYMKEKEQHPYTTDIKYFFKSVYNILFNKIRSA